MSSNNEQACYFDKFIERVNSDEADVLLKSIINEANLWIEGYHQRYGENPSFAELGYWMGRAASALMEHAENENNSTGYVRGYEIGMAKGKEVRDLNRRDR